MPTAPAYDQELIDISFSGPRRTTLDVPLDTIPVFVRDGAVVPGP
jgi:alpha-glucosidase (family GH31 glycosyl hydrolase)